MRLEKYFGWFQYVKMCQGLFYSLAYVLFWRIYIEKNIYSTFVWCFSHSSVGKESSCNAGDPGSIPGSGRYAGERIGYPLQYSGLENYMDRIVHGIAKSQTWLSDLHFHFDFQGLTDSVYSVMSNIDLWIEIFCPVFASMIFI